MSQLDQLPARIEVACRLCGLLCVHKRSRVIRGEGIYCSVACARKGRWPAWIDRFWSKVKRVDDGTSCWLWHGSVFRYANGGTYGAFWLDGQNRSAHRVALAMQLGRPLGEGMESLHKCDTPLCVRNDGVRSHLFEGTQADNMADMVHKGRSLYGERHPSKRRTA